MSNRFKRVLVLMSLGGTSFCFLCGYGGGGCQPFAENQPFVNFLVEAGNYGVQVGVDQALATHDEAFNNWFNDPITNLYQSQWSSGVRNGVPVDPAFDTLLVK